MELNAQRTSVLTNMKFNTGYGIKLMSCSNRCFVNGSILQSHPAEHNFGWVDKNKFPAPLYSYNEKAFQCCCRSAWKKFRQALKASLPCTASEHDSGRSLMSTGG